MYSLLFTNFIRSKAVSVSLVLILTVGITSIYIGRQFLLELGESISATERYQQEHIQRNIKYHQDDIGLVLYYLRFAFINKPDPMTALSIGQRDVNPSIQAVTIRTLEAQKYDTDLNNPANLHSGNLDLGFVIIYLLPLVVIAFTFNLRSEETEGGTWPLIALQAPSTTKYLLQKLVVRMSLVFAVVSLLFLIAVGVLSLQFNASFFAFIVVTLLYLTFWVVLCFWIISFGKNSRFNALALLSIWVLLAIIMPAAVNNFITDKYPVPEALSTMVKQRDGYHEKWDVEKEVTMEKFYSHYPQFRKYGVPEQTFSWLWYYAMQQMGDLESRPYRDEMSAKIMKRAAASYTFAFAVPTMHAQLMFNDLSQSGLGNHQQFLEQTDRFHEKMRLHFYQKIFDNAAVDNEDWAAFEPELFAAKNDVNWMATVLPLIGVTMIIGVLTLLNLRKCQDHPSFSD